MLESWPFVTWPWHDLYLPPSHGHPQYRPVTIQRCYKLKNHIYKALFGLSRRHSQKQQDLAFDLSLTWPVTSIFEKFIRFGEFTTRAIQRRLPLVATLRGSRDIWGGAKMAPSQRGALVARAQRGAG